MRGSKNTRWDLFWINIRVRVSPRIQKSAKVGRFRHLQILSKNPNLVDKERLDFIKSGKKLK